MPTVTQLSEHREALRFQHVYAVYPESIKGLYATLCSAYPTANTPAGFFTQKRRPCVTLADSLAQVGYRTAMFHSGWFAYLGMAGIVADRGFSVLADAGQVGGQYRTSFGVVSHQRRAESLSQ
jgi:phosphoglycerol transferase MdoB-like AlkP superfamily enzyme